MHVRRVVLSLGPKFPPGVSQSQPRMRVRFCAHPLDISWSPQCSSSSKAPLFVVKYIYKHGWLRQSYWSLKWRAIHVLRVRKRSDWCEHNHDIRDIKAANENKINNFKTLNPLRPKSRRYKLGNLGKKAKQLDRLVSQDLMIMLIVGSIEITFSWLF